MAQYIVQDTRFLLYPIMGQVVTKVLFTIYAIYHSTGVYIPTEKMTIGHVTVKLLKV
jgi:hypothetical protein